MWESLGTKDISQSSWGWNFCQWALYLDTKWRSSGSLPLVDSTKCPGQKWEGVFWHVLREAREADKETTVPAVPQDEALFPVAHSSPSQVSVTWVRQMVETVTPGRITKENEESFPERLHDLHCQDSYETRTRHVCLHLQLRGLYFKVWHSYPEALLTLGNAGEKQPCLWLQPHHISPYSPTSSPVYSFSVPEPENRKMSQEGALRLVMSVTQSHTWGNRSTFTLKFNVTLLNTFISYL